MDVFSRKIVGWEVYEQECGELASDLVTRSVMAEACRRRPDILHADNGSPQKSATLRATLQQLGIEPSYSRPRVSNDIPTLRLHLNTVDRDRLPLTALYDQRARSVTESRRMIKHMQLLQAGSIIIGGLHWRAGYNASTGARNRETGIRQAADQATSGCLFVYHQRLALAGGLQRVDEGT